MFQSFQEIRSATTFEMSKISRNASGLQDPEDRAYRAASSLGADLSLDEPVLGLSDLWLLDPTLLVANAHREKNPF